LTSKLPSAEIDFIGRRTRNGTQSRKIQIQSSSLRLQEDIESNSAFTSINVSLRLDVHVERSAKVNSSLDNEQVGLPRKKKNESQNALQRIRIPQKKRPQ
jgi:hypothetical protein